MIQILRDYRGRVTGENIIYAGSYHEDDPLLYGAVDYLLTKGVAVRVGQVETVPNTKQVDMQSIQQVAPDVDDPVLDNIEDESIPVQEVTYELLNKSELVAYAMELYGLELSERLTRSELIEAIENAE